jgi:hypothetical protein
MLCDCAEVSYAAKCAISADMNGKLAIVCQCNVFCSHLRPRTVVSQIEILPTTFKLQRAMLVNSRPVGNRLFYLKGRSNPEEMGT